MLATVLLSRCRTRLSLQLHKTSTGKKSRMTFRQRPDHRRALGRAGHGLPRPSAQLWHPPRCHRSCAPGEPGPSCLPLPGAAQNHPRRLDSCLWDSPLLTRPNQGVRKPGGKVRFRAAKTEREARQADSGRARRPARLGGPGRAGRSRASPGASPGASPELRARRRPARGSAGEGPVGAARSPPELSAAQSPLSAARAARAPRPRHRGPAPGSSPPGRRPRSSPSPAASAPAPLAGAAPPASSAAGAAGRPGSAPPCPRSPAGPAARGAPPPDRPRGGGCSAACPGGPRSGGPGPRPGACRGGRSGSPCPPGGSDREPGRGAGEPGSLGAALWQRFPSRSSLLAPRSSLTVLPRGRGRPGSASLQRVLLGDR